MRPGTLFAAGCVALLAYWRLGEGAHAAAAFFFAMAAGLVVLGVLPRTSARTGSDGSVPSSRRSSSRSPAGAHEPVPASQLSASKLDEVARANAREVRVWRFIVIGGLVTSAVGVFYFPPMALVVAALALYSLHRMRKAADLGRAIQARLVQRRS